MSAAPDTVRRVALLGLLVSAGLLAIDTAPGVHPSKAARPHAELRKPLIESVPVPEPLEFIAMNQDRAKLINAAIPMSNLGALARPFLLGGDLASRARAVDCLASAMWYEAGADSRGRRAVGQVVLNRVRHPSFPATVCGVVFQGAERRTGCQFTFTCDGAMTRRPSERAFAEARAEAFALLSGQVDGEVGLATHYHTDWAHPAWSAKLAKIARVDTHLFFRWNGRWGQPQAMTQAYAQHEPAVAELAALSPAHRSAPEAAEALAAGEVSAQALGLSMHPRNGLLPAPAAVAAKPPESFDLVLTPGQSGAAQAFAALDLCGEQRFCKVIGRKPGASAEDVGFLFVRDLRTGVEQVLWDCDIFPRQRKAQCLSPANRAWLEFDGNLQTRRPNAQT